MLSNVFAVVLAAGSASRFGSTKQLAVVDGVSLVARAVRTANEVCAGRTIVVVGHDAGTVANELQASQGFIVVNDHHADGLGTSLARAVSAVTNMASAVIVLLADQPRISSQHLDNLLNAWSGDANTIVATAFDNTWGPPVLFPSGCFGDLRELTGDAGGKHLFEDPRFKLATIGFAPAALDIDTASDLESLRGA